MDEQILKDFVATAEKYNYDWNAVFNLFPELKSYDQQLLKDYTATAKKYNYDWSKANSYFPEFGFGQQQPAVQPTVQPTVKKKDDMESSWLFGDGSSESEPSKTKTVIPGTDYSIPRGPIQEQVEPKKELDLAYVMGTDVAQKQLQEKMTPQREEYLTKPLQKIEQKAQFEQKMEKIEEATPEYLRPSIKTIEQSVEKSLENFVGDMNYQFGDAGFEFKDLRNGYFEVKAPDGTTETIRYHRGAEPAKDVVAASVNYFVKTKSAPLKGIERIEKLYKDENKKFATEYQVESELSSLSKEQERTAKEASDFLKRKQEAEAALKAINELPFEKRTVNYRDDKFQAEQILKRIYEEGAELQKKIDAIPEKQKNLEIAVGRYNSKQEKQGTWVGGIYNSMLSFIDGTIAGFTDIATDYVANFNPLSGYMTAEQKDKLAKDIKYGTEDELTFMEASRNAFRNAFGDKNTTEQWEALTKQSFIGGAVLGAAEFVPSMLIPGAWFRRAAMYASVNDMVNQEFESNPELQNISENEKLYVKVPIGIVGAVLEEYGLKNIVQNTALVKSITGRAILKAGAGMTPTAFKKVVSNEISEMIADGTLRVLGGGIMEFETGAAQQGVDITVKSIFNAAKGKKLFDTPDTIVEIGADMALAGAQEMIGSVAVSTPMVVASAYRKKDIAGIPSEYFNVFVESASDKNAEKAFIATLKNNIISGDMTNKEAVELLNNYRNSVGLLQSIPPELNNQEKKQAMSLLRERKELESKTEGKDPALVKPIQNRITQINEQLSKLTEDAIQKQAQPTQEQPAIPAEISNLRDDETVTFTVKSLDEIPEEFRDRASKKEGVEVEVRNTILGLPIGPKKTKVIGEAFTYSLTGKEAKDYAIQKQAASQVSVQPEAGAGQEVEVGGPEAKPKITPEESKRKEDLVAALEATDKDVIAIGDELLDRKEAQAELEAITQKEQAAVTEQGGMEQAPAKLTPEESERKQALEEELEWAALQEGGGLRLDLDGIYVQGKIISLEDARAELDALNQKEQAAPAEGLGTQLETVAKEEQTPAEVTLAEQFTEQDRARKAELEEAMRKADKRRKNITVGETTMTKAEAKAELDALVQKEQAVIEAEVQAIEQLFSAPKQTNTGKIKQAVTNAAKAIAKILPKTKIVIHETNDDYVNATGDTDGASGIYIPSAEGGTIHVNLSNANTRTVGHEVFHAILLRGIKTDAEAQRLAKAMIGAVAKSLKQSGANQELLNELENFLSNYEENIQNEEYLAEVFGYLADGYPQLTAPEKSIINRFIERIMKLFGLKPMTDKEVIDFMNTLSRKVATGEEITESDTNAFTQIKKGLEQQGSSGFVGTFSIPRQRKDSEIKKAPSVKNDSRDWVRNLIQDIDIREFQGQSFVTNMYDYTNAGITDLGNGFNIKLFGGKNYVPYIMSLTNKKLGDVSNLAAFNTKQQAETFIRNTIESNSNLFAPHSGTKEGSWQFQQHIFAELVDLIVDNDILSNSELIEMFNSSIRDSENNLKQFNIFKNKYGENIKNFDSFKSNPKEIVNLLDIKNNYSPNLRKILNDKISTNKKFQAALGIKNKQQFYDRIIDPLNKGITGSEIFSIIDFDPSTFKIVQTKANEIDHHPSFGWTVLAKINGIYQPTEFYKSYDITNSYTLYNKEGERISNKEEGKEKKFKESNVTSSAGAIPKVALFENITPRQQKVNKEVQDIEQLPTARKQIIGENAKLAQDVRDNLQVARNMETAGKDAKTIRITTGWEKGKDNKWRYEIDDANVDEGELTDMWEDGVESNLENLLLDSELLKLYPQLKDIKIKYTEYGEVANYNANKNKISIPRDYGYDTRFKSVLLHEIQHAIQFIEGFALGGSPEQMITPNDVLAQLVRELPNPDREQRIKIKEAYQQEGLTRLPILPTVFDIQSDSPDKLDDFIEKLDVLTKLFPNVDSYKKLQEGLEIRLMEMRGEDISFEKYRKLAGEVEARNVQTRMDMTPEQRKQATLQETEDVAREDQVIFFDTNLSPRQQKSKNNQEIIKQARANGISEAGIRAYFKKNGLSDIEIDTLFDEEKGAGKKIILTEETLPGYTKLMNRINDIIARGRRNGKTDDDIMKGVIANVESRSPEYANATDQQREQIIRDIRKLFGKKEKAAPSAEKITGKPKPKKVTVNEMTALKDQIRLEARAAREAKGDLNTKRKMLAAAINDLAKKGKISVRQAKAIVNRISSVNLDNPVMVERLLTYAENIFNDADYDTRIQEVRKLQEKVKKVNHVSMRDTVREFASINPERIPAERLLDYIQALDDMSTMTPFYQKMNDMFDEVMSYKSESKEFDAIKTFQALIDKLESIAINQVKSVEDYVALIRDINSFKRKAYQLLQNGDITQEQYDQAIENVGKDQAAVEKKYEKELAALKEKLVQEINGLKPEVHPDFTPEEAALINKYLELSDADLASLSPEDLYILNDLLNNIKEDVQLDYYRLSEIVSKAYTNAGGQKLAEQLNESKFNKSSDEGKKLLLEQESAFWEGLLGLGRATSGALQKFIVSPFNRAIASYENAMKDGYYEFSKLKKKYKMKDYNMHRLGMFATYLQEYMAQFDSENKNVKDIGTRDWFGEIISNDEMRNGYKSAKPSAKRLVGLGDTELKTIEKIYNSLPKDANGKVDPKAVYDSFMANDGKFFTKKEKAFFDKIMDWKQKNLTTKQKAANEMNGMPFKEIPFHMMRVRLDQGTKQISPKAEGGSGVVRIEAGTGKERASQRVGPIMTNFEQLFSENLEQTARNYYLQEAINDINNTLSVAKKELKGKKVGLFNTIPSIISDALNFEFDKTESQFLAKNLLAARAAETLFNVIRTSVELTSTFLSYPFRAKTPQGYKELFGKQGQMKKLLDFTSSPLRLRENINKAIDISDGRIKPKGKFEKAINYLSGLPERTMMVTSWMPTFNNEFKDITGVRFDMDKFKSDAEYRQKYGKAIKEAAAVADAQTEKIIGSTTKAGGRREIRIAPKILANIFGAEGTIKKNTTAGQILGFFSNYPYREVTEFLNGFREAAEVYKQGGGVIKSISQLQKPLGVTINLATYGFLSSVVYAMKLMLLGDDEDEEKGEGMLKELMTLKGFMEELQGNAISLGASKYAAGGKAMLQLGATVAYNSTSDEEWKAKIKKLLKNSVFVEPIDAAKVQAYGGKNEVLGAIASYVPQFVLFAKRFEESVQTAGELKVIYNKFQEGGLSALSEDDGTKILAIDAILKSVQFGANLTGTSLPMYNDIKMYMKGVKKEAGVGDIKLSGTENKHKKALQNYKNEKEFKENDPEGYLEAIDEGGSIYKYKEEQRKKQEEKNKDKPFRGMSEEAFKKKYPKEWLENYGPGTDYYEEQRTDEAIERRAIQRKLKKEEKRIKAKNKENEEDTEE